MKINDVVFNLRNPCNKCGHNFFKVKHVKPHIGIFCNSCGKWQKWLSKEEKSKYGLIAAEDVNEPEKDDEVLRNILNSIDDEEVPWY